ncbi:uncharacterized protein LOC105233809 [Bactrocera dorsalis]|uniref:Uncharacterized protein LOC105233809 n=1 Tax=Bactrocera dorsalis TaxID=27457 RepID=A0A6I9WAV3_BACDO|nr:uncharacterized protein LOC105233809 [Bactrocera dorsalis]
MRGIAIVFIAFLAYSSAYPLEEQQVSVQVPESSVQVEASEKDAVLPDASQIVKIVAVPLAVPSNAQQLLEVDAGGSASIEGSRQARQFGGFGGYGGYPGYGGYGGYGGYPGYGGYGGFGGYGGYGGGFGGYGGHRHHHRGGYGGYGFYG